MSKQWRCFHCDEVFRSPRDARIHFGGGVYEDPGCALKRSENGLLGIIRDQAEQLKRYQEEDTDLMRVIREMQTESAAEKRDAEQRGYDAGLRDGRGESPP
jgi:hypothetical protein